MRLILFLALFCFSCANGLRHIFVKLKKHEIMMYWRVDWKYQVVEFDLVVQGGNFSWLGLGFSDHGHFEKSDLCSWNRIDGHEVKDGYIDRSLNIRSDVHQDCVPSHRIFPAHQNRIRFTRKFVTCDSRDYAIEFGTTQLIFAIGNHAPLNLNDTDIDKQMFFTSLLGREVPKVKLEKETETVNITAIDAHVPDEVTTYWCRLFELPKRYLDNKYHITGFGPKITEGNADLVHHMEIYMCINDIPKGTEYNGNCMKKPSSLKSCSKVIAAWAMGAEPLYYPKQAGMPLGGGRHRPFIMVEIHYNNPYKTAGRIDSSGFTFTVTNNLRKHDVGIIELGLIYSDANSIPPRQKAFSMSGNCIPQCTKYFPKGGINIFATQQHAHLTGRKIRTAHYRKGVKLGYINKDDHYTPHWQVIRQLENHVNVLPGDWIQTTCTYETKHLNTWTWGGYGIEDEMCVNYIFYYPASDVEVCKSAISNHTLDQYFGERLPGVNISAYGIHEKYLKLKMDQDAADELNEWYNVSPLKMDCLNHEGALLAGDFQHVARPETFAGSYEKTRASGSECPALNE